MGLGPELVTNGTFNTDLSGWTVTDDFQHQSSGPGEGYAYVNASTGFTQGTLLQTLTSAITEGKNFRVSFDVASYDENDKLGGTCHAQLLFEGESFWEVTIVDFGSYSEDFVVDAGKEVQQIEIFLSGDNVPTTEGDLIDNISVREILSGGGGVNTALIDALTGED